MRVMDALRSHVEQVLGVEMELAAVDLVGVPVHLARRYELWGAELLGTRVIFAHARRSGAKRTAKWVVADVRALDNAAPGAVVVLVLSRTDAHLRRRLIHTRTPFVVPGRQLFLPTIGIDLSEHGLSAPERVVDVLDWPAQVVVLRHVLWGDVEERSLRSVATSIGYTAMTLSRTQRQLVTSAVAEVERRGRAHVLRFAGEPRAVWERALPMLRTPVSGVELVRIHDQPSDLVVAGLSALARRTEIADASMPTFAIARKRAAELRREGGFEVVVDEDEADAALEVWNYDPRVLADGDCVDDLSLYLSVRSDPDARMEQAAAQLLERVRW